MAEITSENLPKTGYTKDAAGNFLLNAGAWVKNLEWDSATSKWKYELIGATSEGSKLTMKNTYRKVPIDGMFTAPVGADMIEETEGTFELNMIEHTLSNLKMMLLADSTTSDGTDFPAGYEIIKPKANIEESDYIKNMAYIGTISGSKKPIIILIDYAICTSGLEIEPKDKAEAVYTAVFEARTDPDNIETQALPITILYPTKDAPSGGASGLSAKLDGAPETDESGEKQLTPKQAVSAQLTALGIDDDYDKMTQAELEALLPQEDDE